MDKFPHNVVVDKKKRSLTSWALVVLTYDLQGFCFFIPGDWVTILLRHCWQVKTLPVAPP